MPKKTKPSKTNSNEKQNDQDEIIEDLFAKPDTRLYRRASIARAVVTSVAISAIVGAVAGVIGVLLMLSGTLERTPFFNSFSLESVLPERQVIIRPQQAVTVTDDRQLKDVAMRIRGSVVVLVDSTNVRDEKSADSDLPDTNSVYTDEDVLGFGAVLSSDGWIITLDEVLGDRDLEDVLVMNNAGRTYELSGRIVDKTTGVVFIKIETDGLRALSFADDGYPYSGERFVSLTMKLPQMQSMVDRVEVVSSGDAEIMQSSESLDKEIIISDVDQRIIAPVFNYAGEVVGFQHGIYADGVSQKSYLRPVYHFKSQIDQVLSIQDIIRPILGVTWINLYGNPGLSDDIRDGLYKGAYVVSVEKDSSAEEAGIRSGDILQSVNDIEINGTFNLSEIIQRFGPSDRIIISGLRNGERIEFEIVLDTVQTTDR